MGRFTSEQPTGINTDPLNMPMAWATNVYYPAATTTGAYALNTDTTYSSIFANIPTMIQYAAMPTADTWVDVLDVSGAGIITTLVAPTSDLYNATTAVEITIDGKTTTITRTNGGTGTNQAARLFIGEYARYKGTTSGNINSAYHYTIYSTYTNQDDLPFIYNPNIKPVAHSLAHGDMIIRFTQSAKVRMKTQYLDSVVAKTTGTVVYNMDEGTKL